MCELFGVSSRDDFYANDYLKAFYAHSDFHPHGWGLACVSRNSALVEKESVKASTSNYLRERLSQPITEKLLLALIPRCIPTSKHKRATPTASAFSSIFWIS